MAIDLKQQAKRLFDEVWNSGNLDYVDELIETSYQGYDPLLGTMNRDAFKKLVSTYRSAFPDLKFEVKDVISEGDSAAIRWQATGSQRGELFGQPPTGKTATIGGITFAEYRKGKVVRDYTQWDTLGFMKQLGIEEMAPVGGPFAGQGLRAEH